VTDKVRLASVGLGNWADVLARAVARGSVAEIVNCYSRRPESRSSFVKKHGVKRTSASLEQLLADPEVEGVLITTPNDVHKPVILASVAAGKAVYTDKPIAHSLEDAEEIRRAVETSGQAFSVGHSARRLAGHRTMKDWVDNGKLGGISMVEAHFTTRRGLSLTPESWRYFADKSPGGALIQLGVHHTDTLQHLLGPVRTVSSHARRMFSKSEVPDAVMVLLEFGSGPIGVLATGWAAPAVYQMRLYGSEANLFFDVDLGVWDQSDVIDAHSQLMLQSKGQGDRTPLDLVPTDMFREQVEEFALAIRGEATVEVTLDDSIRALAVVMAALESSDRGGAPIDPTELVKRAGSSTL
jgi:predicted dehydrogenase